jgi:NO-binding membrane sensor protein with MHYT domain
MHGLGERAMNSILRFVQVFALGTWVGSIIYLSFVVTRGAFGVLQSRDQAGLVVGYSLARLHYMGMVAAVLYLVAGFALAPSLKAFVQPAMLGVFLMEMVSVDATPKDNPLRVEFDRLHQTSVRIEVVVLLLGIVSLFFTVRNAGK